MTDPVIEMKGITKTFPGVKALSDVSFDVRAGEVQALVGENGAGKSTLIKILSGVYHADAGEVRLGGTPVHFMHPVESLRAGIAVIYQEFSLLPERTVAQNLFLGREPRGRFGLIDEAKMRRETRKVLDLFATGGRIDPDRTVGTLDVATQQMVEIAKAVSYDARVIVMDEPTASLSKSEIDQLHRIMRSLRDEGRSVIYVTHFLNDILEVTDRITVLRNGEKVHTRDTAGENRETLVSAMLGGEKMDTLYPPKSRDHGEVVLSVRDLISPNGTQVDRLEIRGGEIVGLAGLVGAGRSEIARAIIGADPSTGSVEVAGKVLTRRSIAEATEAGIVMVPEDRRGQGLVMSLPVRANISLPHLRALSSGGVMAKVRERALALGLINQLDVRPAIVDGDVSGVVVHDETNRGLAHMLVEMPFGPFPMALGVIYDDPAPTFESAVAAQNRAASEGKVADLQKLVSKGQTWQVDKEPRDA